MRLTVFKILIIACFALTSLWLTSANADDDIYSPKRSAKLKPGDTVTIKWKRQNLPLLLGSGISISLRPTNESRKDGARSEPIDKKSCNRNTGKCKWKVPQHILAGDYRIHIVSDDNKQNYIKSGAFKIIGDGSVEDRSVAVLAEDQAEDDVLTDLGDIDWTGGEGEVLVPKENNNPWSVGSSVVLEWNYTFPKKTKKKNRKVEIWLRSEGGDSNIIQKIAANVEGDHYRWFIGKIDDGACVKNKKKCHFVVSVVPVDEGQGGITSGAFTFVPWDLEDTYRGRKQDYRLEDRAQVVEPAPGAVYEKPEDIHLIYQDVDHWLMDRLRIELMQRVGTRSPKRIKFWRVKNKGVFQAKLNASDKTKIKRECKTPKRCYFIVFSSKHPRRRIASGDFTVGEADLGAAKYEVTLAPPDAGDTGSELLTEAVIGESFQINWTDPNDKGGKVRLELLKDSAYYLTVVSGQRSRRDDENTYTWLLPHTVMPGENYAIAVTREDDASLTGQSDPFDITDVGSPDLLVIEPEANKIWNLGSGRATHHIRWSQAAKTPNTQIRADLYKGAQKFKTITRETKEKKYRWAVPKPLPSGADYTVRVQVLNKDGTDDTSVFAFSAPFCIERNPSDDFVCQAAVESRSDRCAPRGLSAGCTQVSLDALDADCSTRRLSEGCTRSEVQKVDDRCAQVSLQPCTEEGLVEVKEECRNYGLEDCSTEAVAEARARLSNQAPEAGEIAHQQTIVGSAWSFQLPDEVFTDPDDDQPVLDYAAVLANGDQWPGWLSFDTETRTFSGIAEAPANYMIKVTASDTYESVAARFELTVLRLTILGRTPGSNARAVDRNSSVTVTYSTPLDEETARGAPPVVHRMQRGQLLLDTGELAEDEFSQTYSLDLADEGESGKVTVTPEAVFFSGELVQVSDPLTRTVWEFRTAVSPDSLGVLVDPVSFGAEDDPTTSLAFGDFNGDGDLDLAVGTDRDQSQVYLNDGAGGFEGSPVLFGTEGDPTTSLAFGDFDGDGDLDLAVGYEKANQSQVYLNDGAGGFEGSPVLFGTKEDATTSLAFGDFDGDGDLDLAVGTDRDQSQVYLNDGAGGFEGSPVLFGTEGDPTTSLAFGDFDGDGDLDLAVGYEKANQSQVYLNDGAGGFEGSPVLFGTKEDATTSLAFGDFDGDGDLDLAVGNERTQSQVYLNDGAGGFEGSPVLFGTEGDPTTSLAFGDFDGDGDLDLAVGTDRAQSAIYRNNGQAVPEPSFEGSPVLFGPEGDATTRVAFGDFNGDGHLDLAVGYGTAQSQIYFNEDACTSRGLESGCVHNNKLVDLNALCQQMKLDANCGLQEANSTLQDKCDSANLESCTPAALEELLGVCWEHGVEEGQCTVQTRERIDANQNPSAAGIDNQEISAGRPWVFRVAEDVFSDPDGVPLTFTATLADNQALPNWLTFDPDARRFFGTPENAETLEITVVARDDYENAAATFNLDVTPACALGKPYLQECADQGYSACWDPDVDHQRYREDLDWISSAGESGAKSGYWEYGTNPWVVGRGKHPRYPEFKDCIQTCAEGDMCWKGSYMFEDGLWQNATCTHKDHKKYLSDVFTLAARKPKSLEKDHVRMVAIHFTNPIWRWTRVGEEIAQGKRENRFTAVNSITVTRWGIRSLASELYDHSMEFDENQARSSEGEAAFNVVQQWLRNSQQENDLEPTKQDYQNLGLGPLPESIGQLNDRLRRAKNESSDYPSALDDINKYFQKVTSSEPEIQAYLALGLKDYITPSNLKEFNQYLREWGQGRGTPAPLLPTDECNGRAGTILKDCTRTLALCETPANAIERSNVENAEGSEGKVALDCQDPLNLEHCRSLGWRDRQGQPWSSNFPNDPVCWDYKNAGSYANPVSDTPVWVVGLAKNEHFYQSCLKQCAEKDTCKSAGESWTVEWQNAGGWSPGSCRLWWPTSVYGNKVPENWVGWRETMSKIAPFAAGGGSEEWDWKPGDPGYSFNVLMKKLSNDNFRLKSEMFNDWEAGKYDEFNHKWAQSQNNWDFNEYIVDSVRVHCQDPSQVSGEGSLYVDENILDQLIDYRAKGLQVVRRCNDSEDPNVCEGLTLASEFFGPRDLKIKCMRYGLHESNWDEPDGWEVCTQEQVLKYEEDALRCTPYVDCPGDRNALPPYSPGDDHVQQINSGVSECLVSGDEDSCDILRDVGNGPEEDSDADGALNIDDAPELDNVGNRSQEGDSDADGVLDVADDLEEGSVVDSVADDKASPLTERELEEIYSEVLPPRLYSSLRGHIGRQALQVDISDNAPVKSQIYRDDGTSFGLDPEFTFIAGETLRITDARKGWQGTVQSNENSPAEFSPLIETLSRRQGIPVCKKLLPDSTYCRDLDELELQRVFLVADIDADGTLDLVANIKDDRNWHFPAILLNKENTGDFSHYVPIPSSNPFLVGDFSFGRYGQHRLDLYGENQLIEFRSGPDGLISASQNSDSDISRVLRMGTFGIGDIDADGAMEIIVHRGLLGGHLEAQCLHYGLNESNWDEPDDWEVCTSENVYNHELKAECLHYGLIDDWEKSPDDWEACTAYDLPDHIEKYELKAECLHYGLIDDWEKPKRDWEVCDRNGHSVAMERFKLARSQGWMVGMPIEDFTEYQPPSPYQPYQPVTPGIIQIWGWGGILVNSFDYEEDRTPQKIVVSDIDNDRDFDFMVINDDGEGIVIDVFLNQDGRGEFSSSAIRSEGEMGSSSPEEIKEIFVAHFDGDDLVDIGIVRDSSVEIFRNDGDGLFTQSDQQIEWPEIRCGTNACRVYSATSGDFNGDGVADFALGSDGRVIFAISGESGSFTTKFKEFEFEDDKFSDISSIVNGDFNGDGGLDIAFGSSRPVAEQHLIFNDLGIPAQGKINDFVAKGRRSGSVTGKSGKWFKNKRQEGFAPSGDDYAAIGISGAESWSAEKLDEINRFVLLTYPDDAPDRRKLKNIVLDAMVLYGRSTYPQLAEHLPESNALHVNQINTITLRYDSVLPVSEERSVRPRIHSNFGGQLHDMENFLPGGKQEDWGYQVQESSNDVVLTLTGESRFFPGEEIQISNPATGDVWQFTTRVNSDSPGLFEYSETQTTRMSSYSRRSKPSSRTTSLSALGDFNNDRQLDYLFRRKGGSGEALELILGQSGDSLTADQLSSAQTIGKRSEEVYYVTTGDFNGDGSLDFITGDAGGNYVYLNGGDGQRFTELQLSDLPETPARDTKQFGLAGDFDGDGHLDYLDYRKGVFLNKNGRGTFTLPPRALPNPGEYGGIEELKSAQIGDIDRDGDLDIVDISAGVFLNRIGTGSFGDSPIPLPEVGASDLRGALVLGDFFDNDGFLDILVAETGDNPQFRFWKWQQDSLSYNSSIDLSVDESSLWEYDLATVVKGDFNGDGKLDLATPTKLTDEGRALRFPPEMKIAIWLNEDGDFSGEPLFNSSDFTAAEGPQFFVGDLDSDGDLDIIGDSSTGLLSFWHNSPSRVQLAVDRINNAGSDDEIELNSEDYAAIGISGALDWEEGILDQINQRISDSNGTVLDKGRIEKIAAAVTGEYVACEPGFGSDYGECKICKAGSAGHGSEGCQPCEGMFAASQEGLSACEACPIGQVPDKRHRSCRDNPCEEGKYWDVLANQCRKDAKVVHRWVQMMLWDVENGTEGPGLDVETHDSLNGLYSTLAGLVGETQEDSIDLDSEIVRQATIHSCVSGSPIKESLTMIYNRQRLDISHYGHGRWLTRKDQSDIHNEWSSRAYEFPFDLQNYHKKAFPEVTNAEKLYDLNATDERAESIARCDTLNIAQGDTELDWQKGEVLTHTNSDASSSTPIYLRGLLRRATKAQVREQNKKGRPEKAVFALNISGHGNGFSSASMDLPTIRRIIHEEIGGVELLSFDSCLMGNYESLLLLDGVAKWVFGASHQILIEGSFNFSDETAVEKLLFNAITERSNSGKAMSTKQYVKQLTQYALSAEADGFYSYNAFDMEKFPPFRESFDTVLRYLADNMAENYQTLSELHADDYWVLAPQGKVKYSVKKFLKTLKKSGGPILSSHAANALQNLDELMLKKRSKSSPDVQSHLELINNYSVGLEDTVPTREDYQALGINEAVGWSDDRLESVNAEILDGKKARQAREWCSYEHNIDDCQNVLNERIVQKIVLKTVGRSVEMAFAWRPVFGIWSQAPQWAALKPLRDFNMAWEDAHE